ncbi:MAG TPA: Co2+/Mg2+ efflux protein ApaG [Thermoanaerobaculia bacterium]|nr:Co2+/Mg2+ efflux protein ApaG [Thermoanaerobaculia bacterium]
MSEVVTQGIRVEAESFYDPDRSSPQEGYYFFAYRIRISNLDSETVQLVSREWFITDGNGEMQRVQGPGVVGEQPVLARGDSFEYTSFCPLTTPVGSMHGSYRMVYQNGEGFDAAIAPFALAAPHAVN